MSRTYHNGDRRIRVRGAKKDPPDLRRIARALIAFAQAEAEAEAERQAKRRKLEGSQSRAVETPSTKKKEHDTTDKDAA